ncbi:tetratricopeptide repeat protein [Raineya sp.]|jgi:tetratricopeptide (TPR) repeat protein
MSRLVLLYSLFLLLFGTHLSMAQVDSLLFLARKHKETKEYATSFKYYYLISNILERKKDDEKLSQTYAEIGFLLNEWQIHEKAAEYFLKALEIAQKQDKLKAKTDFLLIKVAKSYENAGNNPKAILYYERLLETHKIAKNTTQEVQVLGILANLYNQEGKFQKALELNQKALENYERSQDKEAQAITLNNLGFGYQKLGNTPQAISYFEKALALKKELKMEQNLEYRTMLSNLAVLYQSQKDFEKSKIYLKQIESILLQTPNIDEAETADFYDLIAKTYFYSGDADKAQKYAHKAIDFGEKSGNLQAVQSSYQTLSAVYASRNLNKNALQAYEMHKKFSDSLYKVRLTYQENLLKKRKISDDIESETELLQAQKDIENLDLKNTILNAEKESQKYELDKQQKIIQLAELEQARLREQARANSLLLEKQRNEAILQKQQLDLAHTENLLKEAELKNAKIYQEAQEAKRKEQEAKFLRDKQQREQELEREREAKLNQAKLFIAIGVGISGILLLALIGFWVKQRDNKKLKIQQNIILQNNELLKKQHLEILEKNDELNAANEELSAAVETISEQKAEIEHKNDEILASINYAQRIQDSMLPDENIFRAYFEESFILYLPRDIVSGDFYWLYTNQQFVIVAVMDCTGHGVPGAFMSLIGKTMLDKIVGELGIYSPEKILLVLDDFVKKAIASDKKLVDGMDGVVFCIDKKQKKLLFAGAKSSMLLFKNDEMMELKGDYFHIAGAENNEEEKTFSLQSFDLDTPIMLYAYSDGYQDQIGGERNKKFMTKKYKQLLTDIHKKPCAEQKEILNCTFKEWKGLMQQTDDVLVMGLKINPKTFA